MLRVWTDTGANEPEYVEFPRTSKGIAGAVAETERRDGEPWALDLVIKREDGHETGTMWVAEDGPLTPGIIREILAMWSIPTEITE